MEFLTPSTIAKYRETRSEIEFETLKNLAGKWAVPFDRSTYTKLDLLKEVCTRHDLQVRESRNALGQFEIVRVDWVWLTNQKTGYPERSIYAVEIVLLLATDEEIAVVTAANLKGD